MIKLVRTQMQFFLGDIFGIVSTANDGNILNTNDRIISNVNVAFIKINSMY